jgi:hypothetical protein
MKLNLIALLGLLMIAGTAIAQHNNFGIKGGLNYYTINSESNNSFDPKVGFHLGIISHIHLANQFAFQPELVFSTQGTSYSNDGSNAKYNLNYINLPLLFQYMFDNGFRFQAGPQIGLLVSAKDEKNNSSVDVKDSFKGADLGFVFGASYVHPPSGFGVDARYNFGLSNINDASSDEYYNSGFQVGVFYLFGHKN